MINIYLARHGQDEDNANGLLNGQRNKPLTQQGIDQAEKLSAKIQKAGLDFDVIYTSPLTRAKTTAQIIADQTPNPVIKVLPELIERDFGVMTGKEISSINEMPPSNLLKTEVITYFLEAPESETFPETLACYWLPTAIWVRCSTLLTTS
jgi:broad specificity phosphatase PhoE